MLLRNKFKSILSFTELKMVYNNDTQTETETETDTNGVEHQKTFKFVSDKRKRKTMNRIESNRIKSIGCYGARGRRINLSLFKTQLYCKLSAHVITLFCAFETMFFVWLWWWWWWDKAYFHKIKEEQQQEKENTKQK